MVEINRSLSISGEICKGTSNIIQLHKFKLKGKECLAVAREIGLLQVYELTDTQYKLVKEWRNCKVTNKDRIIQIGLIDRRYLYSCSLEGKFIIRDMINDDDDNSNRMYRLAAPVSNIKIQQCQEILKVGISGKNNPIKLYEINLTKSYYYHEFLAETKLFNINTTNVNSIQHLRQILWRHNESLTKDKLLPTMIRGNEKDDLQQASNQSGSTGFDWVVSIEFYKDLIICGNQFGFITRFDTRTGQEIFLMKPSTFPITHLRILNNYVIYNDLLSKIGIIDLQTNQEINQFNYNFGPIESGKFIISKPNYFPLVFIVTTSQGELLILKLFRSNRVQLVYKFRFDSIISSFHILRWKKP